MEPTLTENIIGFISLTAICAGLGMDNGLLVELSIRGLKLDEKKHMFWRSVALFLAAGLRIFMLAILNKLLFLRQPLPDSWLNILGKFNHHAASGSAPHDPEPLTWMNVMFLIGGLIIVAMAFWEMYHKYRALRYAKFHEHDQKNQATGKIDTSAIVKVALYLLVMNIIFSLDSVFTAVAMMDIQTQFWWMCGAIITACIIMIVGMVPLSKLIMKSRHFSVTMLVVLILIAAKLIVDGVGGHFPNSVLILLLIAIFGNDAAQSFFDKAAELGEKEASEG
jgi:predicted tellurium resistance membrane protein TerC